MAELTKQDVINRKVPRPAAPKPAAIGGPNPLQGLDIGSAFGNVFGGKKRGKPNTPSAQSYPQAAPTGNAAAPVARTNQNGYTPTTAPHGMDQSNPGVNQQFWNQNQNLWTKGAFQPPGQGQQFWNQVQGGFNKGAQDLTPQFNQYYDQARDAATGEANKQAAARGVYGSSQALNNVGNIAANVEGQRAKASTDFIFGNAANQRANLGQYGDMAFGAEGLGNQQRGLDLQGLNSAFSASNTAENNRNNQIQGQFDNAFRQQQAALGFLGQGYDAAIGNDASIYGGATNAGPAVTAAGLAQQGNNRAQNSQDLSNGLGLYGAFSGGGGSGGQNPNYNPGYYGGPGGVY